MVQISTSMEVFIAKLIIHWERINAPIAKSQEVLKWKSNHYKLFLDEV